MRRHAKSISDDLIDYLTRTHFAEAAIEDALPEEVGPLARALALIDNEPGSAAVCTRVQESLTKPRSAWRGSIGPPLMEKQPSRILSAMSDIRTDTLIAVGGAAAVGQARLAAEHALRRGERLTLIAVPPAFAISGWRGGCAWDMASRSPALALTG